MRRELFDQWRKVGIEKHVAVLGVVDDVDELLDEQARIDGVQHAARAGHAIIQFEVSPGIPGQRRDTIALGDTEACECAGDALGAGGDLPVVGAVDDACRITRDNLGLRMPGRDVFDQVRDQEWPVLHESKHEYPPDFRKWKYVKAVLRFAWCVMSAAFSPIEPAKVQSSGHANRW